jgi:hypothetical protein
MLLTKQYGDKVKKKTFKKYDSAYRQRNGARFGMRQVKISALTTDTDYGVCR